MNIPVRILRWRRPVQVATLAVLCLLPWLNAHGWNEVMGNFYALRLGEIPFADPLAVAQMAAAGALPGWKLSLGAGLVLLLAALLGRVFCGWLCPYGLLSEGVWALRGRQEKQPVRQSWDDWQWRGGIILSGLGAAAIWGAPALNALSTPGLISLAPIMAGQGLMALGAALGLAAALLALEAVTGRRIWCRYACPQALLLMLAARCGSFGVRWTASACSCKGMPTPCETSCSLQLRLRTRKGPPRSLCIQCGQCVKTCSSYGGALRMK